MSHTTLYLNRISKNEVECTRKRQIHVSRWSMQSHNLTYSRLKSKNPWRDRHRPFETKFPVFWCVFFFKNLGKSEIHSSWQGALQSLRTEPEMLLNPLNILTMLASYFQIIDWTLRKTPPLFWGVKFKDFSMVISRFKNLKIFPDLEFFHFKLQDSTTCTALPDSSGFSPQSYLNFPAIQPHIHTYK